MSTEQKKKRTKQAVADVVTKREGMVSHYPLSAVLVVFGIGLGVGMALGGMLGEPAKPRPSFGQQTELAAEKLGRQMLDAIAGVLPESLSKHIA